MEGDTHEEEVRTRALRLLARREHSTRELVRKLLQRGYPHETVRRVADGLTAEGLLSDQRFAEEFVRSRRAQGYGPVRIRADLAERGVDSGLAEDGLQADEADWLAQARAVRAKRFGGRIPDGFREWARQARYLAGRGFTQDQIRQTLGGSETD